MWDTGEIPDSAFKDGVSPQKLRNYTVNRPLLPQLAAIGYTPATSPTWRFRIITAITSPTPACSPVPPGSCRRATGTRSSPPAGRQPRAGPDIFRGLANSKTVLLNNEDHECVRRMAPWSSSPRRDIRPASGPVFKLANTGNLLLSGDLYHYPEEITLQENSVLRHQQGADREEP